MKIFLMLIPAGLSFILAAAHSMRISDTGLMMAWLFFIPLLFFNHAWVRRVAQIALFSSAIIWVDVTYKMIHIRIAAGADWVRLAAIMGAVIIFAIVSILLMEKERIREYYRKNIASAPSSAGAFVLTAVILIIVKTKVQIPMLIAERFLPGSGWIELFFISIYAAWIAEAMQKKNNSSRVRLVIWTLFSAVFFIQLILGLSGFEIFLMTGKLHLPIPAMIVAGPLFRGSGFFMPILFLSTLLVVGPAWCSHLCYIGAWDNLACRGTRPEKIKSKFQTSFSRLIILAVIVLTVLFFRVNGVNEKVLILAGAVFGIIGVLIMALVSRKKGIMIHCTAYCPLGILSNYLGRLSLFRIKIGEGCTSCGLCTKECRYGALGQENLNNKKTGITCTLCGDCLSSCKNSHIYYSFPGLTPEKARMLFITIVVSLHAAFLGIARM